MMKKIILVVTLLALPVVALAQGFVPLAPIPGLTDIQYEPNGLAAFFNNLYRFAIGLAAVLAVIMIIWGGLEISTQDSVSKQGEGKKKIENAILGLVLVLSPVLVFSLINPNILNLSLSLPKIDLTTTPGVGTGTGPKALPPAPTTGCTTAHSGPYLETAVCANNKDASKYSCTNGLTLEVPACKTNNPSGDCADTSVTVRCSGKETVLTFYSFYQAYTGVVFNGATVIPDDKAMADAFINGCGNDGGVVAYEITSASKAFLASHSYQVSSLTNGCPSNSGIVVDLSKYGGMVCTSQILSCNPPL